MNPHGYKCIEAHHRCTKLAHMFGVNSVELLQVFELSVTLDHDILLLGLPDAPTGFLLHCRPQFLRRFDRADEGAHRRLSDRTGTIHRSPTNLEIVRSEEIAQPSRLCKKRSG